MYVLYNDKVCRFISEKRKNSVIATLSIRKKILTVPTCELIPLMNEVFLPVKGMDVIHNKKRYRVKKVNRINAVVYTDKWGPLINGRRYRKTINLPIKELFPAHPFKVGMNYFLTHLMKIVCDVHKEIILKNFSKRTLRELNMTTIHVGKSTTNQNGLCDRYHNKITINLSNVFQPKQMDLMLRLRQRLQTIWHEVLHLHYHGHLNGHFHNYINKGNYEQCIIYVKDYFDTFFKRYIFPSEKLQLLIQNV